MEAAAVITTTIGMENSKVGTRRFFTSVQCMYDRVREKYRRSYVAA
jgi:hypothetical protein